MRRAMGLMKSGDLRAATQTLQDALGTPAPPRKASPAPKPPNDDASDRGSPEIIDVEFRIIDRDDGDGRTPSAGVDATARQDERATRRSNAQTFALRRFTCDAGALDYRLFIPADRTTAGAPLLVMLHGCTQSSEDFARGTRMNQLAAERGFVVAYPEQSASRNPNRCWNWFRRSDQQRGSGEPGTVAALTRHLVAEHGLDPRRIYVAGLSAGAAMAAVLANTDSDLFAAAGVHSGLPVGVAHDIPSALAAMRSSGGAATSASRSVSTRHARVIVFHGDRDTTVHPDNGHAVVAQVLGDTTHETFVENGQSAGGRPFTRTRHRDQAGSVVAESWWVKGAGHAWSGGDRSGTYTDPEGPDASAEMLRFFLDDAPP